MMADYVTGRLSADEDALVVELAGRGLSSGQIAFRLNRNPKTLVGVMYRLGLRGPIYRTHASTRFGKICHPFTPAEDAFIAARSMAGISSPQIAIAVEQEFGHRRPSGSIRMRLQMIAARDEVAA